MYWFVIVFSLLSDNRFSFKKDGVFNDVKLSSSCCECVDVAAGGTGGSGGSTPVQKGATFGNDRLRQRRSTVNKRAATTTTTGQIFTSF